MDQNNMPVNQTGQKKRFPTWAWWLVGVVGGIVLIGLGYMVASNQYKTKNQELQNQIDELQNQEADQETTNTTSSTSSKATTNDDPTADWQIYTNEKYGFSIKYPLGWNVTDDIPNPSGGEPYYPAQKLSVYKGSSLTADTPRLAVLVDNPGFGYHAYPEIEYELSWDGESYTVDGREIQEKPREDDSFEQIKGFILFNDEDGEYNATVINSNVYQFIADDITSATDEEDIVGMIESFRVN